MLVKATYIFEMNGYGWSESHWFQSGEESLLKSFKVAQTLGVARAALLAAPARMKAIRVSDEAVKNDAYLQYVDYPGKVNAEGDAEGADMPDTGILIRLSNLNGKQFKHFYMRGCWDNVDIQGGKFVGPLKAEWQKAYDKWEDMYLKAPFGWIGIDKAQKKTANITNYTENADGQVVFSVDRNIFPVVTEPTIRDVRISKLNRGSVLNGQQQVVQNVDNTVRTLLPTGVLPFSVPGKMTYNGTKVFIGAVITQPQKIVTRRSGAPLLDSHGRARRRARG